MGAEQWEIFVVNEVRDWIDGLDPVTHARVVQAIDALADAGPGLGRPLVDTIHGSALANLKELRPSTVRILFAFDPGALASCSSQATRPGGGTLGTATPSRWPDNATRST
jgi:hypothetical protein